MALLLNKKGTAGAVLLAAAVMAILLLYAASVRYTMSPPPRASSRQPYGHVTFQTYLVILQKPPNADAMDEDAHRRWHESFLPSTVIGYFGERRLVDSYYRYVRYGVYAFSARLTLLQIQNVAKKPGVLGSRLCRPAGITRQCMNCPVAAWDCGTLVSKPAATASQK